jgi:hypothetical protein
MADAEGDVEEDLAGREASRAAARLFHEQSHLLVARAAKAQLIGTFSNRAADVSSSKRLFGEPVDLVPEPNRDPRREEPHAETVPKQTSRLCHNQAPKP